MAQREEEAELRLSEAPAAPPPVAAPALCANSTAVRRQPCSMPRSDPIRRPEPAPEAAAEAEVPPPPPAKSVARCAGCRRKVGLTGIRCRCGELYCSEHRYTDRHECSYDYKAAGREAIARENPSVRAAKIIRI